MREASLSVTSQHGTTTIDVHLSTFRLARDGDKSAQAIICSVTQKKTEDETGRPVPHLYWGKPTSENGIEIHELGSNVHHFNPAETRLRFVQKRRERLTALYPNLYVI